MQTMTATFLERPLPVQDLTAPVQPTPIPACELLDQAIRQQRVSDGYRRLLRAIFDDAWTSTDD